MKTDDATIADDRPLPDSPTRWTQPAPVSDALWEF
jgi:hypothetical protein